MAQLVWKTVWRLPQELNTELPHDPAMPLLGMYPKEVKVASQRDYEKAHVCCSLFQNRQEVAATRACTDG